jgi:hypothetical protein
MAEIIFNNNLTYGAGASILAPTITSLFDQDLVSKEYVTGLPEKLGFVKTRALTPDQTFSLIIGAYELDLITEDQDIPTASFGKGKEKGFAIEQYGKKIGISKLFRKWLETAKTLDGADSSVMKEYQRMTNDIVSLRRGAQKTKNRRCTEVYSQAWVATAPNGAGSPTMYGLSLINTAHPYGQGAGAGVFSNALGGINPWIADDDLNATSLQAAIDIHKSGLRLQNGDRVEIPTKYTLIVSNKLATTARKILNTAGNQVGTFAADGSNSSALNQFSFDGNRIEIVENPFFGYIREDGTTVGTETMWFLVNTEALEMAEALREITLYDVEATSYVNDSNNQMFVSVDMGMAFDHYGAESFIVGSKGTA